MAEEQKPVAPQISLESMLVLEGVGRWLLPLRTPIQREYEKELRKRIEDSVKSSRRYDVLGESFFRGGYWVPVLGRVLVNKRESTCKVIEEETHEKMLLEYPEEIPAIQTISLLSYFMRRMLNEVKGAANNLLGYVAERRIDSSGQTILFDPGDGESVLRSRIDNFYEVVRTGNANIGKHVEAAQGLRSYWAEEQASDFRADIAHVNASLDELNELTTQNACDRVGEVRDAALRLHEKVDQLDTSLNLSWSPMRRWMISLDFMDPLIEMGFEVKFHYRKIWGRKEPTYVVYARRRRSK